ncbi:MAG: InlB B-repeat-containing protein [Treponema sp.]
MKTTIFNKKAHAFFGAAALLFAAVFTIGCKTEISSSDPAPETFTVEMKAGEHGTVTASPAIPTSGKVAKDAVITFTAAPVTGYKVEKWTITGGTFETGTGTEGSTTAKVKISANTKVSVSFKAEAITPPSPTEFTVQMEAGEHGTVTANPAIPTSGKVAKDTVITFTANPASGYKVDKWTITGGTFESGTGTEGSLTAKVKITANTKVNVSFKAEVITPPSPTEFTVEMKAGEHGTVTANPAIPTNGKVAKDTVITFTAAPASGYKVDKWTITGGTFESGTGTEGNLTAKVKISANTKVNVSFKVEVITPPSPTEFTVEMKAGEHGTLSANPAIPTSGKVAKDTVITFTAAPVTGYKVDKWTITGGAFEAGTGTDGSTTAKAKISANTKVNVSFKAEAITPPSPTEFTVQMEAGEHGTVTANPAIPTSGKVAKDTVITFTANPTSGYKVEKWTITGGTFEAGTGTDGSTTAKVKITANTKVAVSFISSIYAIVPFGTNGAGLDNHLKNTAPHTDGIYYIKVTGLTAADLKGESSSKPSALGKILKDNPSKKVALKLGEIPGLTDMSCCFARCTSLTQAPEIPSSVTNMRGCFLGCASLTQAPVIPSSVTNMHGCFSLCANLTQAPVIPSSVTDMAYCFGGCKNLTQAPVIPSSVTNMRGCFDDCKNLTQAPVIPNGVTNMEGCFGDCESLTQAPVIPSSVTNMEQCFECTSLIQAPVIPSSVTNMRGCFGGCKNLTQAPVIPSSVTDMAYCFGGCESLTQAPEIPSSVANMGYCFSGCKKITTVTLKCNYNAAVVYGDPVFKDAFKNCEKLIANSIKVPAGQLQTYKDNASIMGTEPDRFVAE